MQTYLLLRDNRQQGPFTLDELISNGLKPYDLVWAEGKSAAWRYPGELAELKEHAPLVEEQPFDRFFRKKDQVNDTQQIRENTRPEPVKMAVNPSSRIYVHVPSNELRTKDEQSSHKQSFDKQSSPSENERPAEVRVSLFRSEAPASIPPQHARFLPGAQFSQQARARTVAEMYPDRSTRNDDTFPPTNDAFSPSANVPSSISNALAPASNTYTANAACSSSSDGANAFSPEKELHGEPSSIYFPGTKKSNALENLLRKPAFVAAFLLVIIASALTAILLNNRSESAIAQISPAPASVTGQSQEQLPGDGHPEGNGSFMQGNEPPMQGNEHFMQGNESSMQGNEHFAQGNKLSTHRNGSFEQSNELPAPENVPPALLSQNAKDRTTRDVRNETKSLPAINSNTSGNVSAAENRLPPAGATLPPASAGKKEGTINDDYAKQELPIDKKEKKTWKYEDLPATTGNGVRSKTTRTETAGAEHTPAAKDETIPGAPVVRPSAVKLGTPVFTKGTLGGMYDIRIPVKNAGSQKIDLVIVEVQYIKANGEVFQTRKLSLDHLLPGEEYVIKAPDSNRGNRIACNVGMVTSGEGISMRRP